MIHKLEVVGLNNRVTCELKFHPDMNVLTGKNGSGKTTILKLLWLLLSGNFDVLISEMTFDRMFLDTDAYSLTITSRVKGDSKNAITIYDIGWTFTDTPIARHFKLENDTGTLSVTAPEAESNEALNTFRRALAWVGGPSVFFPTFRRIEGGFSITAPPRRFAMAYPFLNNLDQSMSNLSDRLSVANHRFVASISTNDVIQLVTKSYADISEQTNRLHTGLSETITRRIREYTHSAKDAEQHPDTLIEEIRTEVDRVSDRRNALLRPFSVLTDLIGGIFQHRGIRVTEAIILGDVKEAITSDKLSAGEKQMLSFLCYNAFNRSATILIDEPELSLHVDWQRTLFPTLLQQDTDNQFIVATHSPFIYTKYVDRELLLSEDRGGE